MKVSVRLFAGLHELLGQRNVTLDLPDEATVAELRTQLSREYPVVTPYLTTLVCAVGDEYVSADHPLREGDDVALIPPVSGGSDGPFRVTSEPLDANELMRAVRNDESGAVVLFHGVARNHSEGRRVLALDYDAYPALAETKLREVAGEVRRRWPITGIAVLHRTGRLEIGETSLLVAVSSAHRQEAFEACHYAVDRIKQVVPVWKKEIWEDGTGEWAPGYPIELQERLEARR